MNTHTVLTKARELLDDPNSWIKGCLAKTTKRGLSVVPNSDKATCFCLMGAVSAAVGYNSYPASNGRFAKAAIRQLAKASGDRHSRNIASQQNRLVDFNDSRSTKHKDILDLLDRAIASTAPKA